jgi:hypothetical protein
MVVFPRFVQSRPRIGGLFWPAQAILLRDNCRLILTETVENRLSCAKNPDRELSLRKRRLDG